MPSNLVSFKHDDDVRRAISPTFESEISADIDASSMDEEAVCYLFSIVILLFFSANRARKETASSTTLSRRQDTVDAMCS